MYIDMEAIQREEALLDEIDTGREHQNNLESQLQIVEIELTAYKSGGGVDKRKLDDLQTKYDNLKEEQTQLYRTQSGHVQRLLDLNEQIKSKDTNCKLLEVELEKANEFQSQLQHTIDDLQACVSEKNLNIQIMQDELTALQLELLKIDEKVEFLQEENRRLSTHSLSFGSQPTFDRRLSIQEGSTYPSKCVMKINVQGRKELINSIITDHQRDFFAVCTTYPTVSVYSFLDGKEVRRFGGGPKTGINSGEFSPDGELFAGTSSSTGTASPCIYVWNVESEKIRVSLSGHTGNVNGVAFLYDDSQKLITGAYDHSIKIWDLPRGLCIKTIEVSSPITGVVSCPSGIISAHQDGSVSKFDMNSGSCMGNQKIHSRAICSLILEDDLLLATSFDNSISLIDTTSLRPIQTFQSELFKTFADGCSPSLSSDGNLIASGSADGSIFFWDRPTGTTARTIKAAHTSAVVSTSWSRKSNLFLSADRTGSLMIWE